MTDEAIVATLAAAGAGVVGKIIFDWLSHRGKPGNGSAGAKDVAFWQDTFRGLIREELKNFEDRRSEAIRKIIREEMRNLRR